MNERRNLTVDQAVLVWENYLTSQEPIEQAQAVATRLTALSTELHELVTSLDHDPEYRYELVLTGIRLQLGRRLKVTLLEIVQPQEAWHYEPVVEDSPEGLAARFERSSPRLVDG